MSSDNRVEELERLASLFRDGLLDREEFNAEKSRLLQPQHNADRPSPPGLRSLLPSATEFSPGPAAACFALCLVAGVAVLVAFFAASWSIEAFGGEAQGVTGWDIVRPRRRAYPVPLWTWLPIPFGAGLLALTAVRRPIVQGVASAIGVVVILIAATWTSGLTGAYNAPVGRLRGGPGLDIALLAGFAAVVAGGIALTQGSTTTPAGWVRRGWSAVLVGGLPGALAPLIWTWTGDGPGRGRTYGRAARALVEGPLDPSGPILNPAVLLVVAVALSGIAALLTRPAKGRLPRVVGIAAVLLVALTLSWWHGGWLRARARPVHFFFLSAGALVPLAALQARWPAGQRAWPLAASLMLRGLGGLLAYLLFNASISGRWVPEQPVLWRASIVCAVVAAIWGVASDAADRVQIASTGTLPRAQRTRSESERREVPSVTVHSTSLSSPPRRTTACRVAVAGPVKLDGEPHSQTALAPRPPPEPEEVPYPPVSRFDWRSPFTDGYYVDGPIAFPNESLLIATLQSESTEALQYVAAMWNIALCLSFGSDELAAAGGEAFFRTLARTSFPGDRLSWMVRVLLSSGILSSGMPSDPAERALAVLSRMCPEKYAEMLARTITECRSQ